MSHPIEGHDIAALIESIEKINRRLDKLESPFPIPHSAHASLEKFNVAESTADEIFAGAKNEKACTFEPSKPCDHCSMCNSRGF